MGDISEMMLDGTLCEGCGVVLSGPAEGFPRYCSKECTPVELASAPVPAKVSCPTCRKRVKANGLADHMRDAHNGEPRP